MARLRYGPRFQPTLASVSAPYDATLDLYKYRRKFAAAMAKQPLYKRELANDKSQVTRAKQRAKKLGNTRKLREQAEARMVEAIRNAVAMLEFNMIPLLENPAPTTNYKHSVNQLGVADAIYKLKIKCGVKFDPNDPYMTPPKETGSIYSVGGQRLVAPTPEQKKAEEDFQKLTTKVARKNRERKELMAKIAVKLAAKKENP